MGAASCAPIWPLKRFYRRLDTESLDIQILLYRICKAQDP